MRQPKQKIKLEEKEIIMGQYGPEDLTFDDYIFSKKQLGNYSKAIGHLLLSFSELENTLNIDLARSINDKTYDIGYRIIKYLNFATKIKILKDDYIFFINTAIRSKKKSTYIDEVKTINLKLVELSEFRNRVAHADWTSLDKEGFVITKIFDKNEGGTYFKKTKMTPAIILKFTRQNYAVSKKLSELRDKIWNEINKTDYQYLKGKKNK